MKKFNLRHPSRLQAFVFFWIILIAFRIFIYPLLREWTKPDPMIAKEQWYLQNTGNAEAIKGAPEYEKQFLMKKGVDINADELWKHEFRTDTDRTVIVAVIDTGVDFQHENLKYSSWENITKSNDDYIKEIHDNKDNDSNGYVDDKYGYDFCTNCGIDDQTKYTSADDHGTMIAGIIAAKQDDGHGINGIAKDDTVQIMSLKVFGNEDQKGGNVEDVIKAIKYAEDNGAQICNMSFNTWKNDHKLEEIMKKSRMLFVVSTGDEHGPGFNLDTTKCYPACYGFDNVIAVTNLNYNGRLNLHANYGKHTVDVAVPGTAIYSTRTQNTFGFGTGTSFAAPIVSGIISKMYAKCENVNYQNAKQLFLEACDKDASLTDKVRDGNVVDGYNIMKKVVDGNYC